MSVSAKKMLTYALLTLVGGGVYVLIEITFRGYSHISMFAVGGLCLALISLTDASLPRLGLIPKAAFCGVIISLAEFAAGIVLNVYMGLGIWDYSSLRFNLLGQICPQFSLIWIALSVPAIYLSRLLRRFADQLTGLISL